MRHLTQPEASPPGEESARAGLKASATNGATERREEENAGEISKSPEQSQNVIEDKAPAAAEVKA